MATFVSRRNRQLTFSTITLFHLAGRAERAQRREELAATSSSNPKPKAVRPKKPKSDSTPAPILAKVKKPPGRPKKRRTFIGPLLPNVKIEGAEGSSQDQPTTDGDQSMTLDNQPDTSLDTTMDQSTSSIPTSSIPGPASAPLSYFKPSGKGRTKAERRKRLLVPEVIPAKVKIEQSHEGINKLPEEVLASIFAILDFHQRMKAQMTCIPWYLLNNNQARFWKNFILDRKTNMMGKSYHSKMCDLFLKNSGRRIEVVSVNLPMTGLELDHFVKGMKDCSESLRILEFELCNDRKYIPELLEWSWTSPNIRQVRLSTIDVDEQRRWSIYDGSAYTRRKHTFKVRNVDETWIEVEKKKEEKESKERAERITLGFDETQERRQRLNPSFPTSDDADQEENDDEDHHDGNDGSSSNFQGNYLSSQDQLSSTIRFLKTQSRSLSLESLEDKIWPILTKPENLHLLSHITTLSIDMIHRSEFKSLCKAASKTLRHLRFPRFQFATWQEQEEEQLGGQRAINSDDLIELSALKVLEFSENSAKFWNDVLSAPQCQIVIYQKLPTWPALFYLPKSTRSLWLGESHRPYYGQTSDGTTDILKCLGKIDPMHYLSLEANVQEALGPIPANVESRFPILPKLEHLKLCKSFDKEEDLSALRNLVFWKNIEVERYNTSGGSRAPKRKRRTIRLSSSDDDQSLHSDSEEEDSQDESMNPQQATTSNNATTASDGPRVCKLKKIEIDMARYSLYDIASHEEWDQIEELTEKACLRPQCSFSQPIDTRDFTQDLRDLLLEFAETS